MSPADENDLSVFFSQEFGKDFSRTKRSFRLVLTVA